MNYGIIFRLLGAILLALALAFVVCFGVGFAPSDHAGEVEARRQMLVCAILAVVLALVFFFLGRRASTRMFRKEALAVIGLGWLMASVVGALPYLLIDDRMNFAESFFEAASGLTTTGASTYATVEDLPRTLLFWRALSQWIGGMGVIVFFVAILGALGAGAKILYSNEASGSTADFEEPRVQSAVINLWLVYLALSALCAAAFILAGMSPYEALCQMFATVSTGGFSTRNTSFVAFASPTLEWIAIVFMVLGGTSFVLLARIAYGRFDALRKNTELYAYLLLLGGCTLAITPFLAEGGSWGAWSEAFRTSLFQVTAVTTTTGFASVDFNLWPAFPKLVLLMLMVVGGCSGSTAGGVKIARIVVAGRVVLRSIEAEYRPRIVRHIRMNGRIMDEAAVQEVLIFLVATGIICLLAVPLVAVAEPTLALQAALSAVFASLFNIGPGFGEIGPMSSYAPLHDYTKVVLGLVMIMGRLELYAILALFAPALWRRAE